MWKPRGWEWIVAVILAALVVFDSWLLLSVWALLPPR